MHPVPRQPAPPLIVPTLDHKGWSVATATPERFSLIVFYRGLHCPACKTYISELERMIDDFARRGVEAIAISTDDEQRARRANDDWGLTKLKIGHSLSIDAARAWGLYISTGRGKTSAGVDEPAQFSEPGVFLVRSNHTVYFAAIQSMPFARPHLRDVLGAIDFVIDKDYPARGEA